MLCSHFIFIRRVLVPITINQPRSPWQRQLIYEVACLPFIPSPSARFPLWRLQLRVLIGLVDLKCEGEVFSTSSGELTLASSIFSPPEDQQKHPGSIHSIVISL